MNEERGVLVLDRRRVAELLTLDDCIDAVERAFRARGEGDASQSATLAFPVANGGFHVKAGLLDRERRWFVAKANANFPLNRRHGLPTIQGVILVMDGEAGRPLAVMDSIEVTLQRTAAASAVAAKFLARPQSRVVTVCGCGEQGRVQLQALCRVLPIEAAYAYDRQACRSDRFAAEQSIEPGVAITPVLELAEATRASDVIVSCTTSTDFLLTPEHVRPGTFVAAVGTDHPEKREIHPRLMAVSKVVVDDLDQCAMIGDLHHALEAGAMTRSQVHAELASVVAGRARGRTTDPEITIFDSTGIALEDAAAAVMVVERATARGDCLAVRLGA